MMIDATAGYARIPAILSFPDTTGIAETYGFAAASGRVWLEGQYLVPSERADSPLEEDGFEIPVREHGSWPAVQHNAHVPGPAPATAIGWPGPTC